MLNAFRRTCVASFVVFVVSVAFGPTKDQAPSTPANSIKAKSGSFSRSDLLRLRPVLMRDLIPIFKLVYNDPNPNSADIQEAFLSCQLTPLKLGKIGSVVLVEWRGMGGVNVPMLNIYVSTGRSYRKIIDAGGFGPSIVPRTGSSVPDLLFGGTSGVCHAELNRYRYINGRYQIDACDQEYPGSGDACQVRICEDAAHPSRLPTFPDPMSWSGPPNAPAPYFDGPTLTAKQILGTKQ